MPENPGGDLRQSDNSKTYYFTPASVGLELYLMADFKGQPAQINCVVSKAFSPTEAEAIINDRGEGSGWELNITPQDVIDNLDGPWDPKERLEEMLSNKWMAESLKDSEASFEKRAEDEDAERTAERDLAEQFAETTGGILHGDNVTLDGAIFRPIGGKMVPRNEWLGAIAQQVITRHRIK
jgi:hypothetical protein